MTDTLYTQLRDYIRTRPSQRCTVEAFLDKYIPRTDIQQRMQARRGIFLLSQLGQIELVCLRNSKGVIVDGRVILAEDLASVFCPVRESLLGDLRFHDSQQRDVIMGAILNPSLYDQDRILESLVQREEAIQQAKLQFWANIFNSDEHKIQEVSRKIQPMDPHDPDFNPCVLCWGNMPKDRVAVTCESCDFLDASQRPK